MLKDKIQIYLNPTLGQPKITQNGLSYDCPICDKGHKKNLEICLNETSSRYLAANCWGCSLSGLRTLLRNYATDSSWRENIPELKDFSSLIAFHQKIEQKEIELPTGIFPYYLKEEVKKYLLEERGLDERILKERKISYCYSPDEPLYNHIIFPFYEDGRLIGYSAQNFQTKKYKNLRNLNFVAYDEFINWYFPIILTEGVYDSLSVINAIPLLGTKLSKTLLKRVKDKKIILAMDNDTELPREEKNRLVKSLYEYGARVVIIFELKEYKDLNDFLIKSKSTLKEELLVLFELLNLYY